MRLEINFRSGTPVYLQIVEQVKTATAAGAIRAGEALPSIRPLAESLRVNRNTVAKAYTELEREGVIETQAGRGSFVRQSSSPGRKEDRVRRLTPDLDQAVVSAHHLQIDRSDFLRLAAERFDDFEARRLRAAHG